MNDDARRAALQFATKKQRRACHGKIKWPSRKNASAVARALQETFGDGAMSAYRCPLCRGWHVGHDRYRTVRVKAHLSG
jgi:hypothetical protein